VTSTIAEIVFALSIPFSIAAFFLMRPVPAALLVAFGAEMFLPEGTNYKLPYMPAFDKHNMGYVCILLACLIRYPGRVTKLPKEKWIVFLALLVLVGGVATAMLNKDSLTFGNAGQVFIPGLGVKDGLFMGITSFVEVFLPFYVGYALFRQREDLDQLIAGLAIAGLVYVPFALVELRLSPQWHRWIYGYGQSVFDQTIRWGGYRPMVFMSHGLSLARFFVAALFALVILTKTRRRLWGLSVRFLAWTQFLVLVACKSTGAIVLAVAGLPLLLFAKPKRQLQVAAVLAWITVLYPALRLSGIFPVGSMLEAAGALQSERAGSLAFRFVNEDALLARARERIVFGWGEYGRNVVRDEDGKDTSVLDGHWIIRLGVNGVVGFATTFGPLLIPVLWARRRLRNISNHEDQIAIAGIAFTLTILSLDLIPNGLWACYPFFIAGALTRRIREAPKDDPEASAEAVALRNRLRPSVRDDS
jgi:hypothetical protein